MAIAINYEPYAAIGGAARAIGVGEFIRQQALDEERRRQQDNDLALKVQQLLGNQAQDAFNQDMALANFSEGQRRFDTGLAFDDYKQQQAFANQQANLGAQLQSRQASDAADLASQQFRAANERAMLGDRLGAGLAEQQMQSEADAQRQQSIAQRQMEQAALTGDVQLRNRLLTGETPEWVQGGIRDGSLRYTDRQKERMQDLQESIEKARSDPRLSPDEKIRFEAQQMAAYNQVRDNPVEVPFDERPLSMDQMWEQEVIERTNPLTGQTGFFRRGTRGGVSTWEPVEWPKDQETELQFKEREFQIKEQQAQATQEQKNREFDMKLREQQNQFHQKALEKEFDMEMNALSYETPNSADYKKPGPKSESGATTMVPDAAAFNSAMEEWRQKKNELVQRFNERKTMLPLSPPELSSPLPAQSPAIPGQNDSAAVAESPPVTVGPDGIERVVVASEEEAIRYGLPDGTPIIGPDGRTGIWWSQ